MVGHLNATRLPGVLSIPLSVAIRFIPTFVDDCKQIRDVVRLRPGNGFLSLWRGVMVPLVFRTLASADDLAIAAELKGLSPDKKMTMTATTVFSRRDAWVLTGAVTLMAVAVGIQVWGPSMPRLKG